MRYMFLRFPGGKDKAVTMSYDDGPSSDEKMLEIINKYGMKCTFNYMSNQAISSDKIKQLLIDKGHEIAVHGSNHRAPGAVRAIDGIADVLQCRKDLEKKFNRIIRGMAYPDSGIRTFHNCASYENIRNYLVDLGIVYSRTLGEDNNSFLLPTDWYRWMPTAHHNNPKLMEYVKEFVKLDVGSKYTASRYPRLFYLWGHSFEFDRDNNWELLEDFCKAISNKDDIWYATNIEICEYVKAYNSLVFSADSSIIYNPTLKTVWFDVDTQQFKMESGEEIRL